MNTMVNIRQHAVKSSSKAKSRTPAGNAWSEFVVLVFQLNGRLVAAGDELAQAAGQTSARWLVLAAVESAPASVADIARVLNLARQSVQRVADVLQQDGLAEYQENPAHRRAKLLRLTSKGSAALRTIQVVQQPWADALGLAIGAAKLRGINQALSAALSALAKPRTSAAKG
jgi:DNA-binding MarR family transcriptional regulator